MIAHVVISIIGGKSLQVLMRGGDGSVQIFEVDWDDLLMPSTFMDRHRLGYKFTTHTLIWVRRALPELRSRFMLWDRLLGLDLKETDIVVYMHDLVFGWIKHFMCVSVVFY